MTISVRMEPLLEKELELAARRQGITKSQFIIGAVERSLGRKDPRQLYLQVQEKYAQYEVETVEDPPVGSRNLGVKFGNKLLTKHHAKRAD